MRDQSHDPSQCRAITRTCHLDPERTGAIDRARDHRGTDILRHRGRLPGQQRLIDVAATIAHDAIGRHARSRPHQHDVADGEVGHRDILQPFAAICGPGNSCRHVRQQFRELPQRALRLRDGPHLEPVAEQHDGDQRRELFPKRHARKAKRHDHAEDERDTDREGDERHHARQLIVDFAHGALQKRCPSVDEQHRPEHRRNQRAAGEGWWCRSERAGQHVAPDERRQCERQ